MKRLMSPTFFLLCSLLLTPQQLCLHVTASSVLPVTLWKFLGNAFAGSWTMVLRCVPAGEEGSGPTGRAPACGVGGHSRAAGCRGAWVCCWGLCGAAWRLQRDGLSTVQGMLSSTSGAGALAFGNSGKASAPPLDLQLQNRHSVLALERTNTEQGMHQSQLRLHLMSAKRGKASSSDGRLPPAGYGGTHLLT